MAGTFIQTKIAWKKFNRAAGSVALVMSLASGVVLAQDSHDHGQALQAENQQGHGQHQGASHEGQDQQGGMHQMRMRMRMGGGMGMGSQQGGHGGHGGQDSGGAVSGPSRFGQSQFAAIQEIVQMLEQDPETDWSQVNIDALRDHLIIMDLVMTEAEVMSTSFEDGVAHHITGEGDVIAAIQTMVVNHAQQMKTVEPTWRVQAHEMNSGVHLEIRSDDAAQVARIRGLGFAGFMVQGDHHLPHHLMMATGQSHETEETGAVSNGSQTHNH
ncbi:hypothetical protein [Pseudohongiella nitratireducens]|uniref:hypothetical protein n=1 Tax=Pseudohongiella nitratireducens TaxID=1768907 RepID=UPI0030EF8B77